MLPIKHRINLFFINLYSERTSMLTDEGSGDMLKSIIDELLYLEEGDLEEGETVISFEYEMIIN